jgi:hypothetical protein
MSAPWARALVASLAALSILGGCGWISALDVRYPETAVTPAMLASVAPRRVVVGAITDQRVDKARVGNKPKNGDAILTRRPVPAIVREALVAELAKNGHTVVPEAGDFVLTADVEEFWLDAVGRNSTTLYVGRVAIAVVVASPSGSRLLARRYVGVKRREGEADSRAVWREVMDSALARTLHDLATDPEFVATLARQPIAAFRPDRRGDDSGTVTYGLRSTAALRLPSM